MSDHPHESSSGRKGIRPFSGKSPDAASAPEIPSAGAGVHAPLSEPPEETLSLNTRLAYSSSAFAENLALNSVNQLANPVFNLVLGVSPLLVGTALALPRLMDAILDPWIGAWSDRCGSRWGRRRPFILVGALLTALCSAAIWCFPQGRSPLFYFIWLAVGSLVSSAAYSLFVVPYGALGLELSRDYHERTRLMGTRSLLHKASGLINQWLLKLVHLTGGGNLVAGSRTGGFFIGGMVAMLGALTVWRVPERPSEARAADPSDPVRARRSVWRDLCETLRRRDFRNLLSSQVLVYASMLVIDNTGFYLNVFYVHGGDMARGAWIKGLAGTAFQLGGILAIPGIVWLSRRIGKRNTHLACTASIVVAGISKWFCYVPEAGLWLVLPSLLMAPGLVSVMVLTPSMAADVCDLDAARTGARREGMFNAVLGWTLKFAVSGSIFLAGVALELTGWRTELGPAQSPETFTAMRLAFSGGTIVFALWALLTIARYDVTPEAVAASKRP